MVAEPCAGPDRQAGPLVVELCGLPGAGKTTLAHDLVQRLTARGCPAAVADRAVSAAAPPALRLPRKATMVAGTVARGPVRALGEARLVGRGQPARRDRLAVPVQWLLARRLLTEARRDTGTVVIEEGLVQAWWSAALHSRDQLDGTTLSLLAARGPRADVVVHLDVPLELALARLRHRSSRHSRLQHEDADRQLASMQRGDVLLRELLGAWCDAGLGRVLVLDGVAPDVTGTLLHQLPEALRRC
jgi:RecA/RadA recombinase